MSTPPAAPHVTVLATMSINRSSVLQLFSGPDPSTMFQRAPLQNMTNNTGRPLQELSTVFQVPGDHYLGYRVVPRFGAWGASPDDRRAQILTSDEPYLASSIEHMHVSVAGQQHGSPDVRRNILSTGMVFRGLPALDQAVGHTVVGTRHELWARRDESATSNAVPLSYLPAGAMGLSSRTVLDLHAGGAPESVAALDINPSALDQAVLAYFPRASLANGMTYFGQHDVGGGAGPLQPGDNTHLTALGLPTSAITSPEVDWDSVMAVSDPSIISASGEVSGSLANGTYAVRVTGATGSADLIITVTGAALIV